MTIEEITRCVKALHQEIAQRDTVLDDLKGQIGMAKTMEDVQAIKAQIDQFNYRSDEIKFEMARLQIALEEHKN